MIHLLYQVSFLKWITHGKTLRELSKRSLLADTSVSRHHAEGIASDPREKVHWLGCPLSRSSASSTSSFGVVRSFLTARVAYSKKTERNRPFKGSFPSALCCENTARSSGAGKGDCPRTTSLKKVGPPLQVCSPSGILFSPHAPL